MNQFFASIFHNFVISTAHAASIADILNNARDKVASSRIPFRSYLGLGTECGSVPDGNFLACYVGSVYTFFVRAAIILAVLMVVMGGLRWILAVGEAPKIKEAKEMIVGAITGLVLALISFVLFAQINSNLVNLEPIDITPISIVPTIYPDAIPQGPISNCTWTGDNIAAFASMKVLKRFNSAHISEQANTAHPNLVVALNSLDAALDKASLSVRINSISDDNIFGGTCYRNNDKTLSDGCQHCAKSDGKCTRMTSLHYGDPSNTCIFNSQHPPVSCAADLAMEMRTLPSTKDGRLVYSDYPKIYELAKASGFSYVQCENANGATINCDRAEVRHIHVDIRNNCQTVELSNVNTEGFTDGN